MGISWSRAGSLTANAIMALNNGDLDLKPVVQVLNIKQIGDTHTTHEQYSMLLSDGSYMQQARLATQLNDYVKTGNVQKGSVVRLIEYVSNSVQKREIIIVLNMEIVMASCALVGNPKFVDANANGQQQQKAAAPIQSSLLAQRAQSDGGSNNVGFSPGLNQSPVVEPQNGVYPKSDRGIGVAGLYATPEQSVTHPMQNSASARLGGAGTTAERGLNAPPSPYGLSLVAPYQPPLVYSNPGPIAKNEAPARIIPIAALNPYQSRWTIKARVTAKRDLRQFNNARGGGKVFSFDLVDSEDGEIRVTCFDAVADQFYDRIETGRVYMISKGSLKPAHKNYNHLKNEWEICLEPTSTVEPCLEGDNSIPQQLFNFIPISEIENMENNSMVDIIGVVTSINPSSSVMRKNGMETQKRTLQLKDMSGCSVELTMWGGLCNKEGQQLAELCDSEPLPILAVKAGCIKEFSGKSVGTISASQLFINPDLLEACGLRVWFEREGKSLASKSITKESVSHRLVDVWKMVAQIRDEGLGRSERPDLIAVKVTISFIKADDFCYTACPLISGDRKCKKKASNNGDGSWHCEKCDRNFPECDYRYMLHAQVQDHTGLTWVTAFQDAGEEIMGVTAKELYTLKYEEQDDIKFAAIIRRVLFNQYLFKLKVKEETYNAKQHLQCTVVKAERLDYLSESKVLLDFIGKLSRGVFNNVIAAAPTDMGTNAGSYNAGYGNLGYGRNGSMSNSVMNFSSNGLAVSQGGQNVSEVGGNFVNSSGYGGAPSRSGADFGGNYGKSGADVGGRSLNCFKCGQPGHWARLCPNSGGIQAAYGAPSGSSVGFGCNYGNSGARMWVAQH